MPSSQWPRVYTGTVKRVGNEPTTVVESKDWRASLEWDDSSLERMALQELLKQLKEMTATLERVLS